jgi:hypothetical protein|tara:strand:+ start:373 stop:807 length:435 start_codon:yes stop_codon:yes gene_type:complete
MDKVDKAAAQQAYLRELPVHGKVKASLMANVSMSTVNNWRKMEGFALEEQHAVAERVDRIEVTLEDIALGVEDGSAVQVNAARLVLAANRKEYQPQSHTQITGPGGGPLQVASVDERLVEEAVKQLEARMLALPAADNEEPATT